MLLLFFILCSSPVRTRERAHTCSKHVCMFPHRTQVSELAQVISRMQKNADQVEKNVLRAEELLELVRSDEK